MAQILYKIMLVYYDGFLCNNKNIVNHITKRYFYFSLLKANNDERPKENYVS